LLNKLIWLTNIIINDSNNINSFNLDGLDIVDVIDVSYYIFCLIFFVNIIDNFNSG